MKSSILLHVWKQTKRTIVVTTLTFTRSMSFLVSKIRRMNKGGKKRMKVFPQESSAGALFHFEHFCSTTSNIF